MKEQPLDNNETAQDQEQHQDHQPPQEAEQRSETDILLEKLTEAEKQIANYKDQLLRKAAEFENYKRRTESETLNFVKFAGENIITQLLPVLDDLERSLKNRTAQSEDDPFAKGVELIQAKFAKVLEGQGLKPIDCVGKEFNVEFHDALMQVPRSDVPPHTVTEEVEKGYMLFDKVIRHAKVIVSSPTEDEGTK